MDKATKMVNIRNHILKHLNNGLTPPVASFVKDLIIILKYLEEQPDEDEVENSKIPRVENSENKNEGDEMDNQDTKAILDSLARIGAGIDNICTILIENRHACDTYHNSLDGRLKEFFSEE